MDFTRYAKLGIHVKEEPDSLDTLQLKEADESNVLDSNRGWMCKFPCDAQAAFNVSIADSIPNGLQEPIEASLPSYSVDYPESFDINSNVTSTISRESEENENLDCVAHLSTVVEEDEPRVMKRLLEENSLLKRLLSDDDAAEKEELTSIEAAVVPHDVHQKGVIRFNFGSIQENVVHFTNDTKQDKCDEVVGGVENQREVLQNSSLDLIDNTSQNINAVENAEKEIDLFSRSEILNLPKGICAMIKDLITETDLQKKCLDEKSPKKSEHLGFKCPDCDKIIKRSSGFITHMKLHGINQEYEHINIECKNCKKLFEDRKSLSFHKRVCKSSKRSSLNSFFNNDDDNNSNGDVCVPMRCLGENICENYQLESLHKNLKESSSLKGNTHQKSGNILQKNVVVEENNFRQQEKIQISRRRRSSEEKSKLSSSPKKRKLSQSFTECCMENSGVQGSEKSCHSVQNDRQGCKGVDVDYQWFSEIKSDRDEKIQNSKSIILSLRRFRFRRPKILVKRTDIPNHIENVSEANSITSRDTCSNSINSTQTHFHKDNLVYNSTDNEYALEHSVNEPETMSDGDTDKIFNLMSDSNTLASPGEHVSLPDRFCDVTYSKSLDRENCNTKSSSSCILNERSLKCVDVGKTAQTFPKGPQKDLKIKIKPVVVLNRIGLLEYVNRVSTSGTEISKNCNKKTETPPKCDKTSSNLHSTQSENCIAQSSQRSSETLLCPEISSKDQSQSGDVIVSLAENLNNRDCCSKMKNKHSIETISQSFTEKCIMHNTTHSLFDGDCEKKSQSDSKTSFEAWEKQYGLKKCYVKLVRIDDDNSVVKSDRTFNENQEIISELRTCEKLKLHRTNSESWEVSPIKSCHLQNTVHVNDMSHVGFKELTKENDHKKKYLHSISSKILRESSEISGKNQNLALKVNRLKPFRTRCSWCQKIFFNQVEFGEHLKTHFVGYTCHNCSAKFHFWMELQTHLSGCSLASLLNCQNNTPIRE